MPLTALTWHLHHFIWLGVLGVSSSRIVLPRRRRSPEQPGRGRPVVPGVRGVPGSRAATGSSPSSGPGTSTRSSVDRAVEQLTTSGGISAPTWSPDGTAIAYKKRANLVVRTLATGRAKRVATGVDSGPSWSPDGLSVAFVAPLPDAECGEQAVYTVPAAGGDTRLAFDPLSDNCPHGTDVFGLGSWTADGQGLLLTTCYRYRDDQCDINEVSADPANRTVRHVVGIACDEEDTPLDPDHPGTCDFGLHLSAGELSPDGNGVVFSGKGGNPALPGTSSFPDGTLEKVYVVDRTGSGLHQVSTASNGHDPTWSPRGTSVLFTQRTGSTNNVMQVRGTSASAVATVLIEDASQAAWQPLAAGTAKR